MKTVLHRIDSRTNNGNHLRSHLRAIMALDHSCLGLENESLENNIRPNFLRSTSLINKILPTTLGACKPTLHTFYTLHLRWNSNMRRCFYHTDLRQNAVFHNFSRQIALIQYLEPYEARGLLAKPFKKFPKSPKRPIGSHFWQAPNFQWTLKQLRFNRMKNLLYLLIFFI